ncbi:MAG: hypothetical protein COA50_03475 [Flavobacteriaceae bacterium]|nr:MAG: hypothetical protein COA50_03475 [Flavobacteriaceae bacterium]
MNFEDKYQIGMIPINFLFIPQKNIVNIFIMTIYPNTSTIIGIQRKTPLKFMNLEVNPFYEAYSREI